MMGNCGVRQTDREREESIGCDGETKRRKGR